MTAGLEPIAVPLDASWDLDADSMVRAIEAHRPNIVFLPSPNNPTGTAVPTETVAALYDAAQAAGPCMVVVDEAYGEFSSQPSAVVEGASSSRVTARVVRSTRSIPCE